MYALPPPLKDDMRTGQWMESDAGFVPGAEAAGVYEDCGAELCPYALHGECRDGESCAYTHGEVCVLCGLGALHPTNKKLRKQHMKVCDLLQFKKNLE